MTIINLEAVSTLHFIKVCAWRGKTITWGPKGDHMGAWSIARLHRGVIWRSKTYTLLAAAKRNRFELGVFFSRCCVATIVYSISSAGRHRNPPFLWSYTSRTNKIFRKRSTRRLEIFTPPYVFRSTCAALPRYIQGIYSTPAPTTRCHQFCQRHRNNTSHDTSICKLLACMPCSYPIFNHILLRWLCYYFCCLLC